MVSICVFRSAGSPPRSIRPSPVGDQADVAVRLKHDGFQHPLEAIPLLKQGRNQAALLVIPTAHQDVCSWLWGCVGQRDPMPFRIQQAPFPSCGTLTLRLSDGDLWFQADDQTGGQHLALHLSTAHRQSAEKLLFQRPGTDLKQGLGEAQLGRLDDLVCLEGSATVKEYRLRATQGPAMAQQDPGESPTQKNHGDEAPQLNQQGSATLPAQLPSTGHLSGDGPFGR